MKISLKGFLSCFPPEKSSSLKNQGWNELICFPLAISIVKGEKFIVAPLYLGSLYAWLDDYVANGVRSMRRYDIVIHVDSCFLQMFVWERFFILASKLVDYLKVAMEEAACQNSSRRLRPSNTYKPRACRWVYKKQVANLMVILSSTLRMNYLMVLFSSSV